MSQTGSQGKNLSFLPAWGQVDMHTVTRYPWKWRHEILYRTKIEFSNQVHTRTSICPGFIYHITEKRRSIKSFTSVRTESNNLADTEPYCFPTPLSHQVLPSLYPAILSESRDQDSKWHFGTKNTVLHKHSKPEQKPVAKACIFITKFWRTSEKNHLLSLKK